MAEKKFSDLTAKGATIADTDLVAISESAGGGTYTSKSVTGANIKALVTDANMTTTDITTNDVSTSKHGFAPKAPNDTTKFLRGDGTWAVPASGGLTKFTEAENTSAPNGTVYVDSLTAAASSTNADAVIRPKGNGAFILAIPDNTTTGGNKRGQYAVDLQMSRTYNGHVASGNYSFVAGANSTAAGVSSVAINGNAQAQNSMALQGGYATGVGATAIGSRAAATGGNAFALPAVYTDSTASGTNSIALQGGIASGYYSMVIGEGCVADGTVSYTWGLAAQSKGIYGSYTLGVRNAVAGDCQKQFLFLCKTTTNNTASTLGVRGNEIVPTSDTQVLLSNNSSLRFKGTIIGKQSGTTDVAAWDIDGLIVRGANAASTTLVVGNVNLVSNTPAWGTPTLAADTTNGCLRVQVTGAAATNIKWTAVIETTEVIYA